MDGEQVAPLAAPPGDPSLDEFVEALARRIGPACGLPWEALLRDFRSEAPPSGPLLLTCPEPGSS